MCPLLAARSMNGTSGYAPCRPNRSHYLVSHCSSLITARRQSAFGCKLLGGPPSGGWSYTGRQWQPADIGFALLRFGTGRRLGTPRVASQSSGVIPGALPAASRSTSLLITNVFQFPVRHQFGMGIMVRTSSLTWTNGFSTDPEAD